MDVAFTLDAGWPDLETEILFDDPYLVVTELDEGRAGPLPDPGPRRHRPGRLPGDQLPAGHRDGLHAVLKGDLDWVFRTNDNMAVVALVRAGMGAAVVPRLAVDVRDPTVAIHEMDPPIPPRRACGPHPLARRRASSSARDSPHVTPSPVADRSADGVVHVRVTAVAPTERRLVAWRHRVLLVEVGRR